MLFAGYTPLFAGWVGLALTMILILGKALVSPLGTALLRGGFWVALGLVGGALVATNILALETTLFAAIGAVGALCLVTADRGKTVRLLIDALTDGAKSALGVGIAWLCRIIVGIATLTGLAGELARIVLDFAGHSLFLALLMTMVMALILGTGLPTIPTYIVCSAMAAPALLQFGVPLLLSHMLCSISGHHGRSDSAGRARGPRRLLDHQDELCRNRIPGNARRACRLCYSVYVDL